MPLSPAIVMPSGDRNVARPFGSFGRELLVGAQGGPDAAPLSPGGESAR